MISSRKVERLKSRLYSALTDERYMRYRTHRVALSERDRKILIYGEMIEMKVAEPIQTLVHYVPINPAQDTVAPIFEHSCGREHQRSRVG